MKTLLVTGLLAEEIVTQYAQQSSSAVAKYNSLTDAQKAQLATKVSTLYGSLDETDRSKIWAITPKELQGLLRTQN